MKKLKQSLLVAGAVTTVGLTGLAGVGVASAATDTTATGTDPMSSLIDKIASKFNLDKTKLKAVFDQERTNREAARDAEITKALEQLVTDGKITSEQKDKLVAKRAEIKKEMEASRTTNQSKTREEMHTLMDQKRTELEQWAKGNGISTEYLRYLMGGRGGHSGPGGPMGQTER